jgi:ADP-ribose pyrophosphatase YjhB (NUDIX family)
VSRADARQAQSTDVARLRALQARLLARAQQPAPRDWLPVVMAGAEVGMASPEVASFLASSTPHFVLADYRLLLLDDGLDAKRRSALLHDVALRLRDAGLLRGWRGEALDVRPTTGEAPIAVIERAACRTLGITTTAVHLNAFTSGGELVVARRAAHKQIDPGLWDNLVGGMVPAGETEEQALSREAQEEAGLDLAGVAPVRGGRVHVTRRVPEGLQSEIVQVFDAALPVGIELRNQDGEVAAIEARPLDSVVEAIEHDEFTLESALVTLDALLRRAAAA